MVYAAFDNHKTGDFKPYVLQEHRPRQDVDVDRRRSARSAAASTRSSKIAIDPKLLFAGTEFGLFFTQNGGAKWIQLKGGFPTVAVRDLWFQKRHDDLVIATFGRGFYVLDDSRRCAR